MIESKFDFQANRGACFQSLLIVADLRGLGPREHDVIAEALACLTANGGHEFIADQKAAGELLRKVGSTHANRGVFDLVPDVLAFCAGGAAGDETLLARLQALLQAPQAADVTSTLVDRSCLALLRPALSALLRSDDSGIGAQAAAVVARLAELSVPTMLAEVWATLLPLLDACASAAEAAGGKSSLSAAAAAAMAAAALRGDLVEAAAFDAARPATLTFETLVATLNAVLGPSVARSARPLVAHCAHLWRELLATGAPALHITIPHQFTKITRSIPF